MTHFSDFSFLARAVADFCILIWSIMHIYSIDRFDALRWKVIKKKEVKSLMTILFLLAVSSLLAYDIICTKIKYSEGFVVDPLTKNIVGKPSQEWSPENKELKRISKNILMLFYAAENSAVFLLQNFWNYLANKIVKTNFITTWQFRINYAFIVITLAAFSCMPFFFENGDEKLDYSDPVKLKEELKQHTYEEVIPELAATCCNLIVLVYGLMAHFKFSALIRQNDRNYIAERLKYYRHMNLLLIFIVALAAGLMFTLSIDALSENQYLNRHKFTSDLLVGLVNFFTAAFWIVWLMIFYPRFIQTQNGKPTNDDGKYSKSIGSPTSESPNYRKDTFGGFKKDPLGVKHIEIKIDSTTTTTNNTYNNESYNQNHYNNNEEHYNVRNDDYVQFPSPLVTNNRQIVSYTGSPRQYQNFV